MNQDGNNSKDSIILPTFSLSANIRKNLTKSSNGKNKYWDRRQGQSGYKYVAIQVGMREF